MINYFPLGSPQRPRKPGPGPPIKQPLGPQAIGKIKSKQQNKVPESFIKNIRNIISE